MSKKGLGFLYLRENCGRAITHLIQGRGPEWRERIKNAVFDAHRPGDETFYTQWMSVETLQSWRDCSPQRYGKAFDDLTDEEVSELAYALSSFLLRYMSDDGAREERERQERQEKKRTKR